MAITLLGLLSSTRYNNNSNIITIMHCFYRWAI